MKRGFRRSFALLPVLVAACAALLLGACASSTPSAPIRIADLFEATPLVWRATAPDGAVVYLTGSVHLARDEIQDFGRAIDGAWAASEELLVEVDVTALSPQDKATVAARYGSIPAPKSLRDTLSPETWKKLDAYLDSRGIAEDIVIRWKAWFVTQVVVQHELSRAGFATDKGIDRFFIDEAFREGKPVKGLETITSQFQAFDNVPDSLDETLLVETLDRVDGLAREVELQFDTWKDGSEKELREIVFKPLSGDADLQVFYDLVFLQRNRQMASRINQLSGDGKTRFVVVGAGHMVGEDGIPTLLSQRGWAVERIGGKP